MWPEVLGRRIRAGQRQAVCVCCSARHQAPHDLIPSLCPLSPVTCQTQPAHLPLQTVEHRRLATSPLSTFGTTRRQRLSSPRKKILPVWLQQEWSQISPVNIPDRLHLVPPLLPQMIPPKRQATKREYVQLLPTHVKTRPAWALRYPTPYRWEAQSTLTCIC